VFIIIVVTACLDRYQNIKENQGNIMGRKPSTKKVTNAVVENTTEKNNLEGFQVGDKVFVRTKNCSQPWPAQVVQKRNDSKFTVQFYGTYDSYVKNFLLSTRIE
jgi:hypothetical protein